MMYKTKKDDKKKPAHGMVIVIGTKAGPGPSTDGKRDKLDSEKEEKDERYSIPMTISRELDRRVTLSRFSGPPFHFSILKCLGERLMN